MGAESSSGAVAVPETAILCVDAVTYIRSRGYEYEGSTYLEPRLTALLFVTSDDTAVLYCGLAIEY